jgi:hypothetical protein
MALRSAPVAAMTAAKYAMKEQVLRQGYSIGSTPIFFGIPVLLPRLHPLW